MIRRINIEFGHFYGDSFNEESYMRSYNIATQIKKSINKGSTIIETCCLVDDYNAPFSFDYPLAVVENKPDAIFLEDGMSNLAEEVINLLPHDTLRYENFRRDKKHVLFFNTGIKIPLKIVTDSIEKYTCPILTLVWYLFRLNKIQTVFNKNVPIHYLFNILEKRFEENENKAQILLQNTPFYYYKDKIKNIFY